jgi:hypothetical protein
MRHGDHLKGVESIGDYQQEDGEKEGQNQEKNQSRRILSTSACQIKLTPNDSHYENNSNNAKNNVTKIFTTTVMEKKKNINFKVIKNQDKEDFHQSLRHNFEKNNKIINKNDYFQEDSSNETEGSQRIFQNAILDKTQLNKNFMDGYEVDNKNFSSFSNVRSDNYNYYPCNWIQPGHWSRSNVNLNNINMKFNNGSSFHMNQHPNSLAVNMPKKKVKTRENFNYLEMLLTAAEKMIKQGYFIFTGSSQSDNCSEADEQIEKRNSSLDIAEKFCEISEKVESEKDIPVHYGVNQENANNTNLSSESSLSQSSLTKNSNNCKSFENYSLLLLFFINSRLILF